MIPMFATELLDNPGAITTPDHIVEAQKAARAGSMKLALPLESNRSPRTRSSLPKVHVKALAEQMNARS